MSRRYPPPNRMPSPHPQPAVAPKNLEDLLQEADFYLDLGFLSEAKASMDQYRQAGPLDAEFQKRVDRYDSLLKSQGGQSPAPTPEAEPDRSARVSSIPPK